MQPNSELLPEAKFAERGFQKKKGSDDLSLMIGPKCIRTKVPTYIRISNSLNRKKYKQFPEAVLNYNKVFKSVCNSTASK